MKGKSIEIPPPDYPEEAKKQKIEGTVVVNVVIDRDGTISWAKAKSGPPELYAASEQAASRARFEPSTLDGQPVKVTALITYNFVIGK